MRAAAAFHSFVTPANPAVHVDLHVIASRKPGGLA
jgi:hypothetical protein